jgi:hypothetical protein
MTGLGHGTHSNREQDWNYLHVCVDDARRPAYSEMLTSATPAPY